MKCCLYVGSTKQTPKERLAEHLDPPKFFRPTVVTQCGQGTLRKDLYRGMVFGSRDEAESAEASLAAYLQERGYTVFGAPRPS